MIGAISLSGSLVAWAKLDEILKTPLRFRGQQACNALALFGTIAVGAYIVFVLQSGTTPLLTMPHLITLFFKDTDVSLVIGANDVVNPEARSEKTSPIYGMPILNADRAKHVYVIKRGQGKGYAGIVNPLFYGDNCSMVYGDAAAVLAEMIEAVRGLTKAAA